MKNKSMWDTMKGVKLLQEEKLCGHLWDIKQNSTTYPQQLVTSELWTSYPMLAAGTYCDHFDPKFAMIYVLSQMKITGSPRWSNL